MVAVGLPALPLRSSTGEIMAIQTPELGQNANDPNRERGGVNARYKTLNSNRGERNQVKDVRHSRGGAQRKQ